MRKMWVYLRHLYLFLTRFLGKSAEISKTINMEHEVPSGSKPVSVVAPTNNAENLHSMTQNLNLLKKSIASPIAPPTKTNEPNSVAVTRWLQESEQHNTPMYDKLKPLIKEVNISEHTLHIFNLMQTPHIISAEVSSLFPKWKKKDQLSKMLKLKKLCFPSIEISRTRQDEDNEWFYEQCIIEDVLGIETVDGVADTVTLYPLESIINVISLFSTSGGLSEAEIASLSKDLTREYQSFNPNDEFWSSFS